jgi:hypothetical protein
LSHVCLLSIHPGRHLPMRVASCVLPPSEAQGTFLDLVRAQGLPRRDEVPSPLESSPQPLVSFDTTPRPCTTYLNRTCIIVIFFFPGHWPTLQDYQILFLIHSPLTIDHVKNRLCHPQLTCQQLQPPILKPTTLSCTGSFVPSLTGRDIVVTPNPQNWTLARFTCWE